MIENLARIQKAEKKKTRNRINKKIRRIRKNNKYLEVKGIFGKRKRKEKNVGGIKIGIYESY